MYFPPITAAEYVKAIYSALEKNGVSESHQKEIGANLGYMYNRSYVYDDAFPEKPQNVQPSPIFLNRINAYIQRWGGLENAINAWETQDFTGNATEKETAKTQREKTAHDESTSTGKQKTTFSPVNSMSARTSDAQESDAQGQNDGTETETTDYTTERSNMTPAQYRQSIKDSAKDPSPIVDFCIGFSVLLLSPWEISDGCIEE